ncbi:MAG: glycerophosphodiester phosphodiesterase [Proteobacteria bacterium]|nr:glycerophosphodiester phosphodiesterase [Pseudomonadota bacterium]
MRRRAGITIVLLVLWLLSVAFETTGHVAARERPGPARDFYVIGHRGGAGLFPENTLAAFAGAFELGVDAVEMDAHLTADGEVVIYHDSRLKPEITRTADGVWLREPGPAIRHLTVEKLKEYDVGRLKPGTGYAWRFPDQKPVDGARIPTLPEVIAQAKKMGSKTERFWIEIKTSPLEPELTPSPEKVADAVLTIVRRADVLDRTVLLSFDWRSLVYTQRVASKVPTVYLSRQSRRFDTIQIGKPGASSWTAGLDVDEFGGSVARAIHVAGGKYWAPHYREIDQKRLDEAHNLGLRVIVWTPNGRDAMKYLITTGVDGIITDRPDLLKDVLREMGLR